ncbi:hypothetical protein [Achromobacter phage ewik_TL4]|nr:hypothetical protein [Achromobacter phage ewik_TL4]
MPEGGYPHHPRMRSSWSPPMIVDWADCDAKQWDCKPAKMIEEVFLGLITCTQLRPLAQIFYKNFWTWRGIP